MVFDSRCSEDLLDRNWQRLILTHLAERTHRGVLTGAPITDLRITLLSGRAHPKHTEGGDFRQATYRAVRQGLMQAESVLLEPWYAFTLTLPAEQLGRAISDLQTMAGTFDPRRATGPGTTGTAPVAAMDYPTVAAHRGRGNSPAPSTATPPATTRSRWWPPPGMTRRATWSTPPTRSSAPTAGAFR
ncbi:MAG: hypothetical protein ACLSTT_00500 [Evtepia gabavorous]